MKRKTRRRLSIPEVMRGLVDEIAPAVCATIGPDCCVLMCRYGQHIFRKHGHRSNVVHTQVYAFNSRMLDYFGTREPNEVMQRYGDLMRSGQADDLDGTGCAVICTDKHNETGKNKLCGHLLLQSGPFVCDPTAIQFNRPNKGVTVTNWVRESPSFPGKINCLGAKTEDGGLIFYVHDPVSPSAWENSIDWQHAMSDKQIAMCKILAQRQGKA